MIYRSLLLSFMCCILGSVHATVRDDVTTLITFTLQVEKSTRSDHEVWLELATPVCRALVNDATLQPHDELAELTTTQLQELDMLLAYAANQHSLPQPVQIACDRLQQKYRSPRRIPGFEHQSFSASAVTEMMKRSHAQRKKQRMTKDDHKRFKRRQQEEHCEQRKQMRIKRHVEHEKKRLLYHKKTDVLRERERNATESRALRKRKRAAQKKQQYEREHRQSVTQAKQDEAARRKNRLERVREELLKKKR